MQKQARAYAKYETLKANFDKLTHILRVEDLKEHTYEGIDTITLLQNVNLALMLGIDEDEIPDLLQSAVKLGGAMGVTAVKSIEYLMRGLARESIRILDNLGVSFRPNETYRKYPESEKKHAWRQYAMDLIREKAESLTIEKGQLKIQQIEAKRKDGLIRYGENLLK
jgi:hypothetical protein